MEVDNAPFTNEDHDENSHDRENICRFCWSSFSTDENPRIAACKCIGSISFIHYECLKQWLKVKVNVRTTNNLNSYYWKTFECEICKSAYPYILKVREN